MKSIYWDLSGFNLFFKGDYKNLYQVEAQIDSLYGSSNFSEIDTLDWFLLDKHSGEISFLLLTVNSVITMISDNLNSKIDTLDVLDFLSVNQFFINNIEIQNYSNYYCKTNELLSYSDLSTIKYKVLITDSLYFLLDDAFTYQGFILKNATQHITGYDKNVQSDRFQSLLTCMFYFCTEASYEKMGDKDIPYLKKLNMLEKSCCIHRQSDLRIENIIEFIQLVKSNFYDIDN